MWLEPTIVLLPFAAWMFLGVGIPWALVLLPRPLWSERLIVAAVGMALGPLGLTAVMFVLGTVDTITIEKTLIGSLLVAGLGAILAWRRRHDHPVVLELDRHHDRLSLAEIALIAGIVLLLLVNVIVTAYWPFVAYDPLWVYAYNAKIFVMEKHIPSDMGYYPQLIPLSYTYMQQAWGEIDDHAARVVIPWFNVAMVLVAYTLGRLVFRSRRTGLLTAAIWSFYPHVAAWSGAGDLEIPLTLYMTGSAVFFIEAWRSEDSRTAVLSGVLLGGALWTKPTGGALALGVALVVLGWMVLYRAAIWPKLRIGLITGLACAPLGGLWYIRNILLGHSAVIFPADYWHDRAQRSGQELGWIVLIAALIVGGLILMPPTTIRNRSRLKRIILPLLALILLLAGTLPTMFNWDQISEGDNLWLWARGDLTAGGRLGLLGVILIVAGIGLLIGLGIDVWHGWSKTRRETILLLWALLLPYAVVWFLDFSYHYRLSFGIVPLLAVQVAALIDQWVWPWGQSYRLARRGAPVWIAGMLALALTAGLEHSASYWLDEKPDNDTAKYDSSNPALMAVVHMLEQYEDEVGQPVVVIPGEDRLPFFFPTWDIKNSRDDLPTTVQDLDGADIFINNSIFESLLVDAGLLPNSLIAEAQVGVAYYQVKAQGPDGTPWPTVLDPIPLSPDGAPHIDDGNFRYVAYTIHPEARHVAMNPVGRQAEEVIIGDFTRFIGYDLINLTWYPGQKMWLSLYWKPVVTPAQNYSVYVHLLNRDGDLIAQWDGVPMQGAYQTSYWIPGESLLDYWVLPLPEDLPKGRASLRIGIYDPLSGERLPVVQNGDLIGDGITLTDRIVVP